jgi:hypothetical protein
MRVRIFSEAWVGTPSMAGYVAITPKAPQPLIPASHGGRKTSRNMRSEISIAPRSRPLTGWLCPG